MTTWTKRGNVGLIKIRSKRSSVLLLCLLRFFMRQTLPSYVHSENNEHT